MSSSSLLYRRQFIAGPDCSRMPEGWKVEGFGQGWYIGAHPDLVVTKVTFETKEIVCLGHIFDSENPDHDNEMVLRHILQTANSFAEFERLLVPCGGRWLLFCRFLGEKRIYPDPGGTKSAFYTAHGDTPDLWVASQPGLLSDVLGIKALEEMVRAFIKANHGNSWPGEVTPYPGVRQLLPNHYLGITLQQARRFWPTRQIERLHIDDAVAGIYKTLNGLVEAIVRRGPTAIPLTGGHDSRALFAAAGAMRQAVTFFLIKNPNTRYHDIVVPKRVARAFSSGMRVITAEQGPPCFWTSYARNVAHMLWEPGAINFYTFGQHFSERFVVTGGVAETGRCFYYKDGNIPELVTPQYLAKVSEYSGNPIAIRSFASWLATVPSEQFVEVLDLFYIEHRVGNWLGMLHNGFDMVCEVIPAYNSRRYFEMVLGVDVVFRRKPYELFRRVCDVGAPSSSQIPFNESKLDSVARWFGKWVPWRVQTAYSSWIMKRAGFDNRQIC